MSYLNKPGALKLVFINHGMKTGGPLPRADFYLDCRGIADPSRSVGSPSGTGDTPAVQDWIRKKVDLRPYKQLITDGLWAIPGRRRSEPLPYARPYVICTFCAFGIHRSRAMKHLLANELGAMGYNVEVVK